MHTLQTNHYFVFCYNKHFYVARFISVVLAPEERCEGIKTFYWWDFTATLNFYVVSMFPSIRIFYTGAKLIYNLLYVRLKKCSHNPNQRVRSPFHFFHIFFIELHKFYIPKKYWQIRGEPQKSLWDHFKKDKKNIPSGCKAWEVS